MTVLYITIAVLLIIAGLLGTVLPVLPGTPFILAGMVILAWLEDFARVGAWTIAILSILTVLSVIIDFIATALGAQRVGASRLALVGAAIGTIVGLFFGLIGVFVAPFFGAVIGELLARKDFYQAGKVGLGTWLGLAIGTAAKIALACTMLGVFAVSYWI